MSAGTLRLTGSLDGDYGITFYKNGTALGYPPSIADAYSGGGGGYTLNVSISVAANDVISIGDTGGGHFLYSIPLNIWWEGLATSPTPTPTVTLTATPSSTPSAAPSSFITLAYTAGSWSGAGTATSKYSTSSTITGGPQSSTTPGLLPFNFTATSNCEFYLKWSHSGYQDDNGNTLQSTQVLINGNPIDTDILVTINNGVVTDTQGLISNNTEYPIWLTSGDIVTIRVTQNTAGVHHDTFTNVTAYAVARTTSPITLVQNVRGDPSWTGLGNVDSKYSMSGSFITSYFSATLPNKKATFAVKKTGTFYATATVSNYPDDNSDALDIYKNGVYSGQTFPEGTTAGTRSVSVSIGDIIELSGYGNATVSNLSAWVV